MKRMPLLAVPVLILGLGCGYALAQAAPQLVAPPSPEAAPTAAPATNPYPGPVVPNPVVLDWAPPALDRLSAQATARSSFTLDRSMLNAAAGLFSGSDDEARQAIDRLDGVSVRVLRFGPAGIADPAQVDAIRQAYHLRGWKHLVSSNDAGVPVHSQTTDVWLVLDGANVRGAVVLVESPRSLTLVTLAGNLSPVDLLHLRGHFGIPRSEGNSLQGRANN